MQRMHGFLAGFLLRESAPCLYGPYEDAANTPGLIPKTTSQGGTIMTRDELNRELRMHSATWQAVALVYGVIVGTLVLSAMAITA